MAAAAVLRSTIGLAALGRAASPRLSSSACGGSSGLTINLRRRTMATTGGQRGAVWKMCKDAAFTAVAGGVAGGVAGVGMIMFADVVVETIAIELGPEYDDDAKEDRRTR